MCLWILVFMKKIIQPGDIDSLREVYLVFKTKETLKDWNEPSPKQGAVKRILCCIVLTNICKADDIYMGKVIICSSLITVP